MPAPPNARQVEGLLKLLLSDLMALFQHNKIDGLTINSIGTVLAGLKFGEPQDATEVDALIKATATKQAEDIKVMMLRASVVN